MVLLQCTSDRAQMELAHVELPTLTTERALMLQVRRSPR
jgi:hypothetical protein